MLRKDFIKIPNNTTIIYCKKKEIITVIGDLSKKSFKVKVKIFFYKEKKIIKISSMPISKISNTERKRIKAIKWTTIAKLKLLIVETNINLYKKLKLVGVGYKISNYENFREKLITLKLCYSHPIIFKIS